MRIGIDYRLAISSHRGMGRYVKEIVHQIKKLDKINKYILFVDKKCNEIFPENFEIRKLKSSNYIFFEQISLPLASKCCEIDILWCPANTFPIFLSKKIKLIVTIHDLIFMNKEVVTPKNLYQKLGKIYRKLIIISKINRVDKIFTVSKYSKKDIFEKLKRDDSIITYNKIDNFYNLLKNSTIDSNILKILKIKTKEYFYTVSGDAPSKNLLTTIKCFENVDIKYKLVISGIKNYKETSHYKYVVENKLSSKIIFSGIVSDNQMMSLYKNAKGFLFLSLAEGFGIPILEAMFFNLPIIASNRTSIPEILGEGGILVDPLDIKQIQYEIKNIDKNMNKFLLKAQEKQILKFLSWEEISKLVLKEFEKLGVNK